MSVGLRVLRSIIENGSRAAVRELDDGMFSEQELPAYRFMSGFYARHGGLPTTQIMMENGFILPAAEGPVAYFIDRARDRTVFNTINDFQMQVEPLLQHRDVTGLRELLREAQFTVSRVTGTQDTVLIQEMMAEALTESINLRLRGSQEVTGVTLGWPTLNRVTAGAQPGDLISVVARPNVGKSWTMIHMALEAWRAGHSVVFLTMEMTGLAIARRTLGLATGLNPDHIRRGRVTMHAEEMLHEFIEGTQDMPPFHLMSGNFRKSTGDLDRVIQEFSPDIAFADAAYLMQTERKQNARASRWEKVYDLGEEMKGITQSRRRPVVQSLQIGRGKKKTDEFDMDQIAGGDVIGQISDVILAVDFGEGTNETTQRKHIVGKNRDGELTNYTTNFLFNPMNFSERPADDPDDARARLEAAL